MDDALEIIMNTEMNKHITIKLFTALICYAKVSCFYWRKRNVFPVYQVIETNVEVWENKGKLWDHEPTDECFHSSSSPKLPQVFLQLDTNRENMLSNFLLQNSAMNKKEEKKLVYLVHQSVHSLYSCHHYVNSSSLLVLCFYCVIEIDDFKPIMHIFSRLLLWHLYDLGCELKMYWGENSISIHLHTGIILDSKLSEAWSPKDFVFKIDVSKIAFRYSARKAEFWQI